MLVAPCGFAAESLIYLSGFEWLSPLEIATRLIIVSTALAAAVAMLLGKLTKR